LIPPAARAASPGSYIYGADGKILNQVPSAAQTRAQQDQFDTVQEKYEERVIPPDITPGTPPKGRLNPFVANVPGTPDVTNSPGYTIPEQVITRKIPRGAGASNSVPRAVIAPPASLVSQSVNAPTEARVQKPAPVAVGGYVIGRTYKGGLKYLGGNPKVESSWEKIK
jgi:hypothetical protein